MTINAVATISGQRLQKAIDQVKALGINLPAQPDVAPITRMIERIEDVSPERALTLARTLSMMQAFDALVSDRLQVVSYADGYNSVTNGFNSIIEDARRAVEIESKGGPSLLDRVSNIVMKLTRGDIADRFNRIDAVHKDVIRRSGETLKEQSAILDAYGEARLALKEGEIAARELHSLMLQRLDAARDKLREANEKISILPEDADAAERSRCELERDALAEALRREDARYQVAKDLSEMLTVSYSVTETIFARYHQANSVLERLHQKSIIFFDTQRPVLTAMKATFTGILAVNEVSKTQKAMEDGMNKSLESLASLGSEVLAEGLRVASGPSIRAQSVKALVDSVVSFQQEAVSIIEEGRRLSTEETEVIRNTVEEGKKRVADFATRHA